MISMPLRKLLLFSALTLSTVFLLSLSTPKASAAYDAGRLIDDSVFLDANSMSANDIQNFLVAKNSGLKDMYFSLQCYGPNSTERQLYTAAGATCDTPIPASHIIYYAAQIYGVNPKVILATMQKEQSLVTAPNPTAWQLNYAMGYACPTSGSCSSDSSFSYQIDSGTWALRYHFERARGNMTWWHPSSQWTCGTGKPDYYLPNLYPGQNVHFYDPYSKVHYATVFIQNAATSSFYCYTPHVYNNHNNSPHPDDLKGTVRCYNDPAHPPMGDRGRCYTGSFDFVLIFESWFGPTTGFLIRTYEDGRVYLRGEGNSYYYVTSYDQLLAIGYGTVINGMLHAGKSFLNSLDYAGDLPNAVRFGSDTEEVYLFSNGTRHYMSYDVYQRFGQPAVGVLDKTMRDLLHAGNDTTTVIRESGKEELFWVDGGKRHYIGGPEIYIQKGFASIPITTLNKNVLTLLPEGAPILKSGTLIKTSDTGVYGVINTGGTSQTPILAAAAKTLNIGVFVYPSAQLNQIPVAGQQFSLLVRDDADNLYLLAGNKKIHLSPAQLASSGYEYSDFIVAPNELLSRLTTVAPAGSVLLIRGDMDVRVFEVQNQKILHIQTATDFNQFGYSFDNVASIPRAAIDLLFPDTTLVKLPAGALFRIGSDQKVYVISQDNKKHHIANGEVFAAYNLDYSQVRSVNMATADLHETGTPLRYFAKDPGGSPWLIMNGRRSWLGTQMATAFGLPPSTTTMPSSILNKLTVGSNATKFIRIGNNTTVFVVENGQKYPLASPAAFAAEGGTDWNQVMSVNQDFANSMPTGAMRF